MAERVGFRCKTCGEWHDELPLDFGFEEPDPVADVPKVERAARVVRGDKSDFCILDRVHHFIRAVIELPIIDHNDVFAFGVWVSLSQPNFLRARAIYHDEQVSEQEPAHFGWLCNQIPGYPPTLSLKTMVKLRRSSRASVTLEPTDHPLAIEQRNGVSMDGVRRKAEALLHGST